MSKPLSVLLEIVSSLAQINSSNSVTVGGVAYTFVNTIPSAQIHQGISLLDTQINRYPALSVVASTGETGEEWPETPEQPIVMTFSIEGADKVAGRSALSVAFNLLEDIKNAVPMGVAQVNALDLQPDGWQIQEPESGSDLVLVSRSYVTTYYESYPE